MTQLLTIPDATLTAMDPADSVATFLRHAAEARASDAFFLSEADGVALAMRRLGQVQRVARLDPSKGRHVINYVRTMAQMDIAENRRPEDGRWLYQNGSLKLDLRVNATPTLHGYDLAVRLLARHLALRELEEIGLAPVQLAQLEAMLHNPSGLILVSGPAGAGKTTTLYACLQRLNSGSMKINTLEDPVEYELPGVRQSQVVEKIGLTFAELLRHILRQAPDVIMIGEIRDPETAETAVRAASTGHLVLATLHAPTATGAVQSMMALGAHPHFLATCLRGAVAQRLVRVLCPQCRVRYEIPEAPDTFAEVRSLLEPGYGKMIFGATGCDACYGTGYADRIGLFEVLTMSRRLRDLVAAQKSAETIRDAAIEEGMLDLRRAALLKVANGVTTTEEILRDVSSEHLGLEDSR